MLTVTESTLATFSSHRRDDVVVRASAAHSVDLGFIPLVESYQKTLKNGIHSFPAWRSAQKKDNVENKPASLFVVSLGKTLNGTPPSLCGRQVAYPSVLHRVTIVKLHLTGRPHLYVADRWPKHLGNSNSQASTNVPSKT